MSRLAGHGAPRRRRPLREHDLGHAERGLAAELAGDPRARLAARDARADVLARGGAALLAPAGHAAAHDALARASRSATGEPYLAWGTPGGDQQEQWALHAFVRHVDLGMNLQEAIDAPEFHTDHLISSFFPRGFVPKSLALESRFDVAHRRRPAAARARRHAVAGVVARPRHAPSRASPTVSSAPARTRAGCRATRSVASVAHERAHAHVLVGGPVRAPRRDGRPLGARAHAADGRGRASAAADRADARLPARRGRAGPRASSSASRPSTTTTRSASSTPGSR